MERLTEQIAPAVFREVLGRFASGITVVASADADGRPVGLACQSFASLSLDPPLVMLCVGKSSTSWPHVARTGRFTVSVLAEEQREVCAALGGRGGDKFDGVGWTVSEHGTVRIDGALATVDCALHDVQEAGDHLVVTGEVLDLAARPDGSPLLYFGSAYAAGDFR
ncbi:MULTISPECIES: flavin reductase family protein [unclassified Streptomyces]|uniref:flavin reductase family protein n=1 Tax=unclassified Streptomyces TaxID=2593676 RepID=UPI002E218425|nr:flavin reductase family protein [Streptomyces sp. NBC_01023]